MFAPFSNHRIISGEYQLKEGGFYLDKILDGLGHNLAEQTNFYSAEVGIPLRNVKVDLKWDKIHIKRGMIIP